MRGFLAPEFKSELLPLRGLFGQKI
jgi:hypothetical protein